MLKNWFISSARSLGFSEDSGTMLVRECKGLYLCVYPKGHPYYHFGIFDKDGNTVAMGSGISRSDAIYRCETLCKAALRHTAPAETATLVNF